VILAKYDPSGKAGTVLKRYNERTLGRLLMAGYDADPAVLGTPPLAGGDVRKLKLSIGLLNQLRGLLRILGTFFWVQRVDSPKIFSQLA
jgi:hypothetical protein